MKLRKSIVLLLVSCSIILLVHNSCKKEKAQAVVATVNVADTCSSITYSKTIAPIITTSCAIGSSCHGSGSSHIVFNSYASIQSEVSNGKLTYSTSPASVMGKGLDMSGSSYAGLTTSQTNQFICWLKNGAPNN